MNSYPTSIGTSDQDSITVLGHDLARELIGEVGFGELAFWLVAMRRPTRGELRAFEAVLVALADHGFTPTALAARLTLTGAPESIQGALAAGLLGTGSRFLGVTEDTGRFLDEVLGTALSATGRLPDSTEEWDALALQAVQGAREAGVLVPGLGHTVHKMGDPRTPVLFAVAREEGVFGPHLQLFDAIGRTHHQALGLTLPLNGAGACGALLCDLGFDADIVRGFALLARAAGLLGHIAEEHRRPIGRQLYADVEHATRYLPPDG